VSDEGIGIADEVMETIFDPFFQGDMSSTPSFGGIGLGLLVAKELLPAVGGEISVRSNPGRGSTFAIRLPVGSG